MTPPKTFGTLLVTDPAAAVDAMIDVLETCGSEKMRWLARVQIERDPDDVELGPYAVKRKELP